MYLVLTVVIGRKNNSTEGRSPIKVLTRVISFNHIAIADRYSDIQSMSKLIPMTVEDMIAKFIDENPEENRSIGNDVKSVCHTIIELPLNM